MEHRARAGPVHGRREAHVVRRGHRRGRGLCADARADASVAFVLPPERAPKPGTFGAALKLDRVDKPGGYQITLSDEAWLDVVQAGARVKSTGFSGQKDCPGVRKSVRFDLQAGPATIQVSNAGTNALNLALEPAQ